MSARYFLKLVAFAVSFAWAHSLYAQSAQPLKTVVPVLINAQNGNITVGSTVYPASSNPGMNMLALNRQPDQNNLGAPDVISNQTFTDADSANNFLVNLQSNNPGALLLVNAVGNYGFALSAVAQNLENFGAAKELEAQSGSVPLVLIGNGGRNVATANERVSSTNNMSGYLATDSNGNYTFLQPDYIKYDIGLDGSIKIGSTTYTVANSGGCNSSSNAFQVVAVQRETPSVLVWNNSYCTAQSDSEISRLAGDLGLLLNRGESVLVFIASAGHPIPSNWNFGTDGDPRITPVAKLAAELGGYWETVAYLTPSDTYSLVGAAPPSIGTPRARNRAKESSSVYPGNSSSNPKHQTGELHGVLARGLRGNWYSPLNADPTGKANMGLYQILGQQPVAFPHPATAQELAAFQSISNQLSGNSNIRNQYPDQNVSIADYRSTLENMSDPNSGPCSANPGTPFCIVRQQLLTEFAYVVDIRKLGQNLQTLWLGSGTVSILELLQTYGKLTVSLQPPPAATTPSLMGPVVNFFLSVASFIPDIGAVFGIADSAFNLGMSLTTDPNGNPAVTLTSTVANLEGQAVNLFTAQANTTGTQFALIYQDWGKISALGANLETAQPGSAWFWNSNATAQILQAMAPAIETSYYQSLMAAVYAMGNYLPYGWGNQPSWGYKPILLQPGSYGVYNDYNFGGVAEPFALYSFLSTDNPYRSYSFPTAEDLLFLEGPATSTLLADTSWIGISSINTPNTGGEAGWYQPPKESILAHLFNLPPPAGLGGFGVGLGVYRPAFFESWSFPRVPCDSSDPGGEGDPGTGCDWASGAPAPESLPAPLASISMRTGKAKSNPSVKGQFDIRLLISNNGTLEARSIDIIRLRLRTLAGSGEAVLANPDLPIHFDRTVPGALRTVTLHINIPPTIKKLAVSEEGEVDTGEITRYKFSLGQVVFPDAR